MASKVYELASVGNVTIVKRRSSRHLRLSIAPDGQVRVSIPSWAPYQAGLDFARSKQLWIEQKRPQVQQLIHNQPIGRAHRLSFVADIKTIKPKSRISGNLITITHPLLVEASDPVVQKTAMAAATKALRKQAESLLPQRLESLAKQHSLTYSSVSIKQLKRRWGSCDQKHNIVLNLYLIQLPWELIDYVLLHELAHTKHLNHGPDFWSKLLSMEPRARQLKKEIGAYHPGIL